MRLFDYLITSANEMENKELVPFQEWHDAHKNQLVLIIKPEITALQTGARPVLDMVEAQLSDWHCEIRSVRLIGPSYLRRHQLIDSHYGAINKYSRRASQLSLQPPPEFEGTPILGAHEFLEAHPDLEPRGLLRLHGSSATMRLDQGAYAFHYVEAGESLLIVNGFHPAQLDHFYSAPTPILTVELSTDEPWHALRNTMVGATDPGAAKPGSIRRTLLDRRQSWGIEAVDSMRNGVHLSAGPLEGGQELLRFFSPDFSAPISVRSTNVGGILSSRLGNQEAKALLENVHPAEWDTYTETELMDTWHIADWLDQHERKP